jgi:aspartyl-tRNA(Asn)/glutamyl-tRNA(Gln) amidotransferase subunit A
VSGLDELCRALRSGARSSRSLAEQALAQAEASDLGAFLTLDADGALAAADLADRELADGTDRGLLHGIPVAVKDNLCTAGLRTTCGSLFLEHWVPPYDATVVQKLRAAGAVVIGKTNMDEFAMGSSNENSAFGPVRNPRHRDRVAGGSSGGSAAAVAAGIVPLALGSDTGGSVRQPAALCGVVGFRPTHGRVSRSGLIAFASSLDQVGPLATDVVGAAALYEAIAGPDPLDSTCSRVAAAATVDAARDPADTPIRVGVPHQYLADLSPEARSALDAALAVPGFQVVPIDLPHTEYAVATYYVLASAEASSNLARFDGIRFGRRVEKPGATLTDVYFDSRSAGFGPEVQRRIMLGTFALSEGWYDQYYGKAERARRAISADFSRAFETVDLVASLTSPTTAFALGERSQDPLTMYLSDIFTVPASLAGLPSISVPVGSDADGLPWGLQLTAPPWAEAPLFSAAARAERACA